MKFNYTTIFRLNHKIISEICNETPATVQSESDLYRAIAVSASNIARVPSASKHTNAVIHQHISTNKLSHILLGPLDPQD